MEASTFKMPGLWRYKFDLEGNCYKLGNKLTISYNHSTLGYRLTLDDGTTQFITMKEIRIYGRHLKEMTQLNLLKTLGLPFDLIAPKSKMMVVANLYSRRQKEAQRA